MAERVLEDPVKLPSGQQLKNRIGKAAMTEGLADECDDATERHETLYRRWAKGGAGLLITGNVMVDRRFLERPGNVVIDQKVDVAALARWAEAGTIEDTHLWVQINHPGRQCQRTVNSKPVAPSEVGLELAGLFARPRALESHEIREIIDRFAFVAKTSKDAGFTGVQIHSAHGYLGSQFLSPRVNRRDDEWGGPLENRARFLLETIDAVRDAVGPDFPVAVKMNSADFSKGGFSTEDSARVAEWVVDRGIDLLEISGGTYESIAFIDGAGDEDEQDSRSESTKRREAYFLDYAAEVRGVMKDVPLMMTGGFRTASVIDEVVESGEVDVVGLARPFCVEPDLGRQLLEGEVDTLPTHERGFRLGPGFLSPSSSNKTIRAFNSQAGTAWYYQQILHLADGEPVDTSLSVRSALIRHLAREQMKGFRRVGA